MTPKKKLITRMALWTGVVLAVALLTAGTALLKVHAEREQWEGRQRSQREQIVERSRQYLGELARKINALPVNPTLVGEIESRYFEEYASSPMSVWAMDTDGTFLFGVPRESFNRLNAIYDREITPRLKEGVFLDRQSFLLGQLDERDEAVLLTELADSGGEKGEDVWERLTRHGGPSEDTFVLSAPLQTEEGAALGSIYLKRLVPEREYFRPDDRLTAIAGAAGTAATVAFVFLWILLPTWVYVDARERGARRAMLFAFLTVLSSLIGFVVYLIARPEDDRTLVCPGCGRELNGGAFCPHCGRDLSASFCVTCRYPLKPDWAFCPTCRTEIKAPAPEAPPPAP